MRIPKNLNHGAFNTCTLLLVAARQGAKFYIIENGIIEEVDSFAVKSPAYSDREGFFATKVSGSPGIIRTGSVYEEKDKKILDDLKRKLRKHLVDLSRDYKIEKVFLFHPDYMKNYIKKFIPRDILKRTESFYEGNFYKSKIVTLLEKISHQF